MNLTRRTFLKAGAGGAGLIALSGSAGILLRDRIEVLQPDEIVALVRSNFDYLDLRISDGEIEEFYAQYRKAYRPIHRAHWQFLIRGRGEDFYQKTIDELMTTFLMSTDFFLNGADESKPVRYMQIFSPYDNPCWNPLVAGQYRESADANT